MRIKRPTYPLFKEREKLNRKVFTKEIRTILRMRKSGYSFRKIAEFLEISHAVVYSYWLRKCDPERFEEARQRERDRKIKYYYKKRRGSKELKEALRRQYQRDKEKPGWKSYQQKVWKWRIKKVSG